MEDLTVIAYSTKKYVDATTLSRIRSHAQSRVQDRKSGRPLRHKQAPSAGPIRGLSQSRSITVFDALTGAVRKVDAEGNRHSRRLEETTSSIIPKPLPTTEQPSLLPIFKAIEATDTTHLPEVDENLKRTFDKYYRSYKWSQSPDELLMTCMSNPGLWHSMLAVLFELTVPDPVRAIHHENETIDLIYHGLEQFKTLSPTVQSDVAEKLIWPVLRLATIKAHKGELSTAMSHLNALAIIWPTQAQLETSIFGDHLRFTMGVLLMFNFAQPYVIHPAVRYPYGTFIDSAFDEVIARGFDFPISSPLLSISPMVVDERLIDAMKALTALCRPHLDDSAIGLPTHRHDKKQSIEFVKIALRLADLPPFEPTAAHPEWYAGLQECLRLSALLFTFSFGRRKSNHPVAVLSTLRRVRKLCTPALLCQIARGSKIDESLSDLILWILIVCGSTSDSLDDSKFYSLSIRHLAPSSLHLSYRDLEAWGQRLPWLTSQTDSPVEDFWDLVCGRPCRSRKIKLPSSLCAGLLHERNVGHFD